MPENAFADASLSDALRRGAGKIGDMGREVAANYGDLQSDVVDALPGPPGATVRMLREYLRNRERTKRTEQFGEGPTIGPAPFATHSSDPGVKLGAMALDPANLAGAGTATALRGASKLAKPAAAIEGNLAEILRTRKAPSVPVSSESGPILPRAPGGAEAQHIEAVQEPIARLTDTGRAPKLNERSEALLKSRKAANSVDRLIQKGRDINPDLEHWYASEPLRQFALNEGLSQSEFDRMLAHLSNASQRNPVERENLIGSYMWGLDKQGILTPEKELLTKNKVAKGLLSPDDPRAVALPEKLGSLAQGDIFERAQQLAGGAKPDDIFAEKIKTYLRNKMGNQVPVTVDVNAMHGPLMDAGLTDWLKTLSENKNSAGKVVSRNKPRADFESGKLSLKQARERPGFWEDAPATPGEYQAAEELWTRGADRAGVSPAGGQALGWYGSGDITALKTEPQLYMQLLEKNARTAAARQGITPTEALRRFVRGEKNSQLGRISPPVIGGVGALGVAGAGLLKATSGDDKEEPADDKKKVEGGRKREAELEAITKQLRGN